MLMYLWIHHSLMATIHLGNVNSSLMARLLLTPSYISCQFLLLSYQPLLHLPMPAILGEVPVNTSLIQDSCWPCHVSTLPPVVSPASPPLVNGCRPYWEFDRTAGLLVTLPCYQPSLLSTQTLSQHPHYSSAYPLPLHGISSWYLALVLDDVDRH